MFLFGLDVIEPAQREKSIFRAVRTQNWALGGRSDIPDKNFEILLRRSISGQKFWKSVRTKNPEIDDFWERPLSLLSGVLLFPSPLVSSLLSSVVVIKPCSRAFALYSLQSPLIPMHHLRVQQSPARAPRSQERSAQTLTSVARLSGCLCLESLLLSLLWVALRG